MGHIYFAKNILQEVKVGTSLEKELLQAALRFDRDALGKIYDLYSPELYRYATRFLGDPAVAEDCVADTFSRFLKAIHTQRGPQEYLRAYLYRIAHNWIADYYRRAPNVVKLKETQLGNEGLPEHETDLRLRQSQMRKALMQLTPDQQRVIGLKYLEDWNNEEIARALRKPVGAVKSLQHRALATLKRILEKENTEWATTLIP